MKKYIILIVGINCYYGHLLEFIVNLKKKNPLVEISLFTSPISDEMNKELSGYVKQIILHKSYTAQKIPRVLVSPVNYLMCFLESIKLRLAGRFDIIDVHFANQSLKNLMPFLKNLSNNILISPWGSEVMRVEDEKTIMELRKIYSYAKYITVGRVSRIGRCIMEKFQVDPEKMVKLGWGGEFFDYIQENANQITVEEAKRRFGLKDRYVITCGYNTQKGQRHLEILEAINGVKDQLPENLTLLIPCTYVFFKGMSDQKAQYIDSIKEKCKLMGFDLVVVEEHLDLNDLLKLRMATDIFVHVQQTDAGSRSVMEYVYCNKKVVHGSWVYYYYLDHFRPSCYFPVDKIDNLGDCIVKAYHSEVDELPVEVRNMIFEKGWNHRMGQWNEFFESLVSE